MEKQEFETTNISDLWLRNIFENVKNLENMERLAREGCSSILEFAQMSRQDQIFMISEIQYKNLKMMTSEIILLLSDISSIIDNKKYKKYKKTIEKIDSVIHNRKLFILESWNRTRSPHRLISKSLTKHFNKFLEFISSLKIEIIEEISPMLFVKKPENKSGGKLK